MRKLYYSISEVCQLIDEEQHILRYWEKEFPQLKPKKNRAGNRIYSEKDLFLISSIKKFLRDEKISLKTAKEMLSSKSIMPSDDHLFSNKLGTETSINRSFQRKVELSSDKDNNKLELNNKLDLSYDEAEELLTVLKRFSKLLSQSG